MELLSGTSLAFLIVTNWAKFVFELFSLFVKKHFKNRGFSRFVFFQQKSARAMFKLH